MPKIITESVTLAEAAAAGQTSSGRMTVQIITPGWGSSGYYSAAVLQEAAKAKLVTKGTPMYLDHPTESEKYERPVRSVRDMAAVFTEDARWTGSALVAEAQVFTPYRPLLSEMAEHIGVSIRAGGELGTGEAEGRKGPIIESVDEVLSVDFVTAAGRGGRVLELLESALSEASESDTRDALRAAVNDAHAGDDRAYAYVRDYDPDASLVWFECSGLQSNLNGLFQQSYSTGSGGTITLAGTPVEVRVKTTYVPVHPAGPNPNPQESEEDTMPNIEEARLRELEAAHGRVPVLESERDTEKARADKAERALAESKAREQARPKVQEIFSEATTLAPRTVARAVDQVVASAPLTDKGDLDEAKLKEVAEAARKVAEAEAAEYAAAAGAGTITGFGGQGNGQGQPLSEADKNKRVANLFGHTDTKAS